MKISIIIPAWNVEQYIVKCIESCLRLKGADTELIVVNDGSTDNTLGVINENFHNLKNLRIYSTENRGLSAARNYGMKKATGDYVIFLDADDWLRTDINHIFENSELFNDDLDVLFFCCQMIDEMDERRLYPNKPFPVDTNRVYTGEEIFKLSRDRYAASGFLHFAWLGIYNKDFLTRKDIRFIENIVYEDYAFWFDVMRSAQKIRYSGNICYAYRLRNGSITHVGFSERVIDSIFKTMINALAAENASDEYLACVGANLELMTIYAEMRTSTKNADYLKPGIFESTLAKKLEIVKLVDKKYPEYNHDWIKIKYRLLSHIVFCFGIYDEGMLTRLSGLREKLVSQLEERMDGSRLLTGEGKIGLYGHGSQPDVTINTYVELFGETGASCVYVDSTAKSHEKKHYNRDVINVCDLKKEGVDEVIICTNYHEESMRNTMEKLHPDIEVYSPYKDARTSLMWVICGNYVEIFKRFKETEGKKRIILLETPEYPNVGDQLIAISEKEFLRKYFSEYEIIDITNDEYAFYKCRLKIVIQKEDILAITGGGFFGGLWRQFHYDQALDIISGYPDNEVWVFPQSVFFEDTEEGEKYKQFTITDFERSHLKVVCREKFSYGVLLDIVTDIKSVYQCPDIALYHKFEKRIPRQESIGIFFRFDKEAVIEKRDRYYIDTVLVYSGLELIHSSMQYECEIHKQERNLVVEEKLEEIAGYRLVVTDTLHCMISCAITGTPCIAFNNLSRKLEGVYDYLKDLYYIRFLYDVSEFEDTLNELIRLNTNDIEKPDFTGEWDRLADYLMD